MWGPRKRAKFIFAHRVIRRDLIWLLRYFPLSTPVSYSSLLLNLPWLAFLCWPNSGITVCITQLTLADENPLLSQKSQQGTTPNKDPKGLDRLLAQPPTNCQHRRNWPSLVSTFGIGGGEQCRNLSPAPRYPIIPSCT